ncbi:MAG: hypothetical protein ACKVP3_01570 [Hyphomicrobiaceae bacterium]
MKKLLAHVLAKEGLEHIGAYGLAVNDGKDVPREIRSFGGSAGR